MNQQANISVKGHLVGVAIHLISRNNNYFIYFSLFFLLNDSLTELRFYVPVNTKRPSQHKTGHFGNVPQANLLTWYGKTNKKASIR